MKNKQVKITIIDEVKNAFTFFVNPSCKVSSIIGNSFELLKGVKGQYSVYLMSSNNVLAKIGGGCIKTEEV